MVRRTTIGLVLALLAAGPARAEPPAWLPRYDVKMDLDLPNHVVQVNFRATWTNPHTVAAHELVFNAHSRYLVPDSEIGLTAKTLEILRVSPEEAMGVKEPALEVHHAWLANGSAPGKDTPVSFHFEGDTKTALVIPLPFEVKPGESVTVVLDITMKLPQKQGRWGQWKDVTFLSNWLPVFAVFGQPLPPPAYHPPKDEKIKSPPGFDPCWQPTPFIPWHQPFFNEAGMYHVWARLPVDQTIACTGAIVATRSDSKDTKKEVEIVAAGVRDFAFLCSTRFREFRGQAEVAPGRMVPVRICAFAEHEHYAREMVRIASEAIEAYSRWFGPYPYAEFTIVESYFGWLGNECATLVMIDERVFGMPHLAGNYVEYLVSHETCHQWWYNLVGTNGYCETWMDEALATYFAHRLLDRKLGVNNNIMNYPRGLEWLPNIHRNDYRNYGFYGCLGRGDNGPIVRNMEDFGHIVNLFSMCYDKGSKVVGMIEERLGEAAFLSFMRRIRTKYEYRIIRIADFQRELDEYTGRPWEKFFTDWLYGSGLSDWAVEKVEVEDMAAAPARQETALSRTIDWLRAVHRKPVVVGKNVKKVTVNLRQYAEYDEETTLGIALASCDGYSIRIPILPQASDRSYRLDDLPATVEILGPGKVRVEVELPEEPVQIAVDPDQVLVDKNPANNVWKTQIRWRFAPVYTFLEETDLTNAYDRWNVIFGPWIYGEAYDNPWFALSPMVGLRAGAYRTQEFTGGVYAAYRTDYKDVVVGADGLWDHWPDNRFQVGFNVERRLFMEEAGNEDAIRGAVFGRYIFQYGDSLYLPPMHYIETFAAYQDNFLPDLKSPEPGGERFNSTTTAGLHYRLDYLTPYWDPQGGFRVDAVYQGGLGELLTSHVIQEFTGQFSFLESAPDLTESVGGCVPALRPALQWFADTRFAFRAYGAIAVPTRGEFFTLGGPELFRGYDLNQKQGSAVWIGSAEWRVPLARGLSYDAFDHVLGLRNMYGAVFYDVGDAYVNNRTNGPISHAVGAGLRFDVSWFSFVERTLLRIDVAKTVNTDNGVQVWFDVVVPF